jgi:O-antigen/teichoic acid export membrane protein
LIQTALFVAAVVVSSFWTVLLAYFSFNIVAGIALTAYLFNRRKWRFTFIPPGRMFAIVRSMARVSFHAFFLTISAILSNILGPIISGALSGLVAAGDFANIQKLFSFLTTSHLAILAPIGPTNTLEASAGNWDAIRRRLRVCVLQLWPAFFLLAGGALWCIHPFVIRLWLGYTFRNYNLAALLLVWVALCAFVNTFSAFLNNLGLLKIQAAASFGMILPNILLPIFLGRWFGIPGIVLGQILCVLPAVVIWPIYTRRVLRLQLLRV